MLVPPPPSRLKSKAEAQILEKITDRQVVDFMEARGWRTFRQMSGMATNQAGASFRFGEQGIPDRMFLRYLPRCGYSATVWVEMKRVGVKLSCHCHRLAKGLCTACGQREWKQNEIRRGALVVTVGAKPAPQFVAQGEIAVPSIVDYIKWYDSHFAELHDGRMPGQLDLFQGVPALE